MDSCIQFAANWKLNLAVQMYSTNLIEVSLY